VGHLPPRHAAGHLSELLRTAGSVPDIPSSDMPGNFHRGPDAFVNAVLMNDILLSSNMVE